MAMAKRWRWVLLPAAWLASTAMSAAAPAALVQGMDHMPLAVRNLDQARSDFEKLGFVLKPGRHHDDGIRNAHVKFADGTEIELITAAAPTDALAAEYADFLKSGDGPAFWSLYSADLDRLTSRLAALGLTPHNDGDVVTFSQAALPHRLFFADRARSPTDKPAYFIHPNTAYRLAGVWLAGAAPEASLMQTLGAIRTGGPVCAPFAARGVSLSLPEATVVFVSNTAALPSPRSLIGATVMVRNLNTARAVLRQNHVALLETTGCGFASLWIRPQDAHNAWLELRQ